MHNHNPHPNKGLGIGIISAIASAGLTYFLFNTEQGNRSRQKIKDAAYEAKDKVLQKSDEVSQAVAETYSDTKSFLREKYEGLKNLNPEQRKELIGSIKGHLSAIRDDIDEIISEK